MTKAKVSTREDLELFGELVQMAFRNPEGTPDRLTVISLSDEEQDRLITGKRLELIHVLRDQGELTISELARAVGRRLDAVSRDLAALERYGIVDLKRAGRTKRVRLKTELILLYLGASQQPVTV